MLDLVMQYLQWLLQALHLLGGIQDDFRVKSLMLNLIVNVNNRHPKEALDDSATS